MTDTYRAASPPPAPPPASPTAPHADEETRTAAPTGSQTIDSDLARLQGQPADAPPNPAGHANPEGEGERRVWAPPVPQYPARPSLAAPVQYAGPQPQATPHYIPPQPPAPPQPGYSAGPPYAPQPQYAPQQANTATMYASPQQVVMPPPSPRMSRGRVGRRFLRRVVTGGSGIGKMLGGGRLPLTLLFLALAGVITWLAIDRSNLQAATSAKPNAVAQGAIVLPPESNTVTSYLAAFKKDDVETAWNALSPKEKIRRLDNGEDKAVMKEVLSFIGKNNVTANYRFVGAYGTNSPTDFSKGGIYYYVIDVSAQGQQITRPMFFVVDEQGKVDQVYDPLYRLVMANIGGN